MVGCLGYYHLVGMASMDLEVWTPARILDRLPDNIAVSEPAPV